MSPLTQESVVDVVAADASIDTARETSTDTHRGKVAVSPALLSPAKQREDSYSRGARARVGYIATARGDQIRSWQTIRKKTSSTSTVAKRARKKPGNFATHNASTKQHACFFRTKVAGQRGATHSQQFNNYTKQKSTSFVTTRCYEAFGMHSVHNSVYDLIHNFDNASAR